MTNKIDFAHRLEIYKLLEKVLTVKGNGIVEFYDGWDDHRVAEELGEGYTYTQVRTMRQTQFGKLYVKDGSSMDKKGSKRLGEVLDRLAAIEEVMTKPDHTPSNLGAALSEEISKLKHRVSFLERATTFRGKKG